MAFYDYPLTKQVTGNTAYETLHTLYFQGTAAMGTPTKLAALAGIIDSGAVQNVRVMDVTNGLVVAEKIGITAQSPADVDLGSLSNLSTGLAIWEVQALSQNKPGPDGDVAVGSLRLEL